MNERLFNQPPLPSASPRSTEKPREIPEPRSDSRPAGERLAGVLRVLLGSHQHHGKDLDEVDLLHPDVSVGPAGEQASGPAGQRASSLPRAEPRGPVGGNSVSNEKGLSVESPAARARSVVRDIVRAAAPVSAPKEIMPTPATREVKNEPPSDVETSKEDVSIPESTERGAKEGITDEDRQVVKLEIRKLQMAGERLDGCFPLNQADLDRLALSIHGMPVNDNAQQIVLGGLNKIAARHAA